MADVPDWLTYNNRYATRSQPLDPRLIEALSFLPELGLSMEVFSGGQPAEGPNRTGSHRHDYGGAGDVFFSRGGQRLNWANEADLPVFQEIVRRAKAGGVTGFGAGEGYMQPGSMHLGFGSPSVWGAGGSSRNAPDWLRAAYYGGDGNLPLPTQYAVNNTVQPDRPDGPKGQEAYAAPAPPLPAPTMVADRPVATPSFDQEPPDTAVAAATQEQPTTMAGALGKGLGAMGKAYGEFKPQMSRAVQPGAARVDASDTIAMINPQQAEMQRQMLAQALARLNAGRLG